MRKTYTRTDLGMAASIGLLIGILVISPINQAKADLSISGGINGAAASVTGNVGGNVVGSVNNVVVSNSYTPQAIQSATVSTNALSNIINVSEQGELIGFGLTAGTIPAGDQTFTVEIQIDGGSTASYSFVMKGSGSGAIGQGSATNWLPVCTWNWATLTTGSATFTSTADPSMSLICPLYLPYKTSLRVAINSFTGSSGSVIGVAWRAVRS